MHPNVCHLSLSHSRIVPDLFLLQTVPRCRVLLSNWTKDHLHTNARTMRHILGTNPNSPLRISFAGLAEFNETAPRLPATPAPGAADGMPTAFLGALPNQRGSENWAVGTAAVNRYSPWEVFDPWSTRRNHPPPPLRTL